MCVPNVIGQPKLYFNTLTTHEQVLFSVFLPMCHLVHKVCPSRSEVEYEQLNMCTMGENLEFVLLHDQSRDDGNQEIKMNTCNIFRIPVR